MHQLIKNKVKNIPVYGSKCFDIMNYFCRHKKTNLRGLFIDHLNNYRVRHRIALEPGHWHAAVKAKNSFGWSQYSNQEDLIIDGI